MTMGRKWKAHVFAVALCVGLVGGLDGCQQAQPPQNTSAQVPTNISRYTAGLARVTSTSYSNAGHVVRLYVTPVAKDQHGEDIVETANQESIVNFATTVYHDKHVDRVEVVNGRDLTTYTFLVPNDFQTPQGATTMKPSFDEPAAPAMAAATTTYAALISVPPAGVTIDRRIRPLAGLSASRQAKASAVLKVAASKLGTPYIWGHNEDRGQYGFDCSNFTSYVYHHALGYRFTGSSQGQYRHVGDRVSQSQMQTGDLIIFESGGHVGIYAGGGRVIQEGGGLGKVGYLSIRPGSYWGRHISAVKRMF